MMENLKVKKPYEMALKYSECYWNNFFAFMEIDEKALTFLKLCKEKQIPVCLVTDMLIEVQIKKVVKLNISDYIEYIVSSEEAGIEKPDEKIFTTALKKLKIKPSEAIMIGDCYEKDIVGADNLGIKSYQVEVLNSTRK
ncbi:MAG: Pyrimidine 5'-nucleotidase YjjG [Alphaproteobacteria bacterium ADurb.Bin438]|nr:MAG: Pyrimidine 5'-nucleotidase YjjG [Alphaproteobacteria bacterium ADurb.Bin438]